MIGRTRKSSARHAASPSKLSHQERKMKTKRKKSKRKRKKEEEGGEKGKEKEETNDSIISFILKATPDGREKKPIG